MYTTGIDYKVVLGAGTMDAREQRGMVIAARCRVVFDHGCYMVPSQRSAARYCVWLEPHPRCTCPDYELSANKCKHIHAVEYTILRESKVEVESIGESEVVTETVTVTATKRVTYKQDWPAYNAAQTHEKDHFLAMLADLCGGIVELEPGLKGGRPPVPMAVRLFSAIFKVYSTVSCRRFSCDLKAAHEKGYIDRLPHYNSVLRFLEDAEMMPVLRSLVGLTAAPLKAVESDFAVDSSGFSTCRFDRWFDHKHGREKIEREWVKVHIACGVKTNVVTAVEIAGKRAADAPMLPKLVDSTAENFTIRELSADLAYSGNPAFKAVAKHGGTAYIPFKTSATGKVGGLFAKMFHYFNYNRDEYLTHYHKRSNVESAFSMIKAKFGDGLRSKSNTAMVNESLCKIVCHNICCLIQSVYELGITARFWSESDSTNMASAPALESDDFVAAMAWI